ncbi:hypothetical protein L208DRAFT_1292542, partial [Tricholoma matsutake]
RRIRPDIKECALRLWKAGWDRSKVCWAFNVSQASLYCWMHILEEFGSTTCPPSPLRGRPRIITFAVLTAVKQLYEQHTDTYLNKLQWFLAIHHDIDISISALQVNLDKAGLTRKILHKIAKERDKECRAARHCIQNHFSGTRGEFVAVDEYGCSPVGNSVPGSLNSFAFFDFIVDDVLPQMNPYPDNHSILIMDNCRIHHTDMLQDVLNDSGN